ncbi:group II intron reverse transcriptase/maturase [uncultured Clostridium sp.]|uniref:group II intron reverse transcriptase/maturase n=1 Tax=uncultured Clostridium sp. TaxID=59620 RepID=UPI00267361B6|nr:group II intron reverse transcriptase/maturase [uncultured Clostridium sp.]
MTTKKQKIRNNEYYNIQEMFDDLYDKSKNKKLKFKNLMQYVLDERNIELAYRNIKKNKGSKTKGTNSKTIVDISTMETEEVVNYVRKRLINYQPQKVRRVEIPKANGSKRPLGIPTIEDRLIQQCILQVLEPICEAKFYNHNYGFRPNRSAHNAVGRAMYLANKAKLEYVVDIDIKGFFDNVNHSKLLKQMWSMRIQDKNLICIIGKMLKAPIEGIGVPNKGTPQGGILSPLLSNIVLNELDWWIADQWESFETNHNYDRIDSRNNTIIKSHKYRALRKSKMKEIYIVRYADDFKIFCKNYEMAKKIYIATKNWLSERLQLEISTEKSKIVNLNKNYSEFLGFRMKLMKKNKGKVIKSRMSEKSIKKVKEKIKEKIDGLNENTSISANKYNATILGVHNYYKVATHVNRDFRKINHQVSKNLFNQTKNIKTKISKYSQSFMKFYGNYNGKFIGIQGIALYPIYGVTTKTIYNFKQETCNYTEKGRELIHQNLKKISWRDLQYLMENPKVNESIEYNDNRISLYVAQNGLCAITKEPLDIENMDCHHKIPKYLGGTDEYQNLILVTREVHILIHATREETINKILQNLKIGQTGIKKINKLRKLVGNNEIK